MNDNGKRRIVSLLLATSIIITSFGLTSCGKKRGQYATSEKASIYEEIKNGPDEWFCDIFVEDYNDNILEGAEFVLKDEHNNLIDSWVSDKKAHRLIGLEDKIYILTEVKTPDGYIISGNNSWVINPGSGYRKEILGIKNIKKKDYKENDVYNILNTGKKEYINDEYFVLKIKDSYDNKKSIRDHLEYRNKLPKYILLKGTQSEAVIPEYSNTIQYEFNDATSGNSFNTTNVVMTYNGDGYYSLLLYRSYLGIKGKISNDNLFIVPLYDLSEEEFKELESELSDYPDMLDKIYFYNNKTKTLVK